MRTLIIVIILLGPCVAWSQIRAFDNSKAILPWLYNPSADFAEGFQAYAAYDGRGDGNYTPQSIVAGIRMPVQQGRRNRRNAPSSIMGVQLLKTSHDILKSSTLSANFAHRIPITRTMKIAFGLGAGIFDMKYNYDALVYYDQPDPMLNSGVNFFNFHLNAGVSLEIADKLNINLATPYLIKDHRTNPGEVIFRVSYVLPLNPFVNVITSANLDTYNKNMIFGGDIRMEWRKMVSIMAGADRYKLHGGLLLNVKPFSVGYTYGMNYNSLNNYIPAHQIAVFSNIPLSR